MPAHPGAVLHIEHITSRNPLARQRHSYRRTVNGRKVGGPGEFHTRPGDPGTPIDGGE